MSENQGKRREWVKTAAIIFLTVMLVLTFFSNTIMNYSLPEVATQYVQSGSITAKVRGSGTVQSDALFEVNVTESRKVEKVAVRVGDSVEIGDVIFYLMDVESEELAAAREDLEQKQRAYEIALLSGDLSVEVMQNGGAAESMETYRNQLIAAKKEVEAAQAAVDAAQAKVTELENLIAAANAQSPADESLANEIAAVSAARIRVQNATFVLTSRQNKVSELQNVINHYQTTVSSDEASPEFQELKKQKKEADELLMAAQAEYNAAKLALEQAEAALSAKQSVYQTELITAQSTLSQAQAVLDAKQTAFRTLSANISASLSLNELLQSVEAAEKKVADLEAKSIGATITAQVAGTITAINVVAGESTVPGSPAAMIQPGGKGYTLSFSVTNNQAARISAGDPAEVINSWWYTDVTATVASIRPDPDNPSKNKLITFQLSGNLTAGQTLNLQVGQRSSNYDAIVPNSAIREDNNGKFVLVVETKSSPLGNRYYAVRYDVEVLASDDTQSAVSGLYGYECVITTSTKPITAGQMVRLPD